MLEKHTFDSDEETNAYFRANPDAYIIKMVITGGRQHFVISKNKKVIGRDHLMRGIPIEDVR